MVRDRKLERELMAARDLAWTEAKEADTKSWAAREAWCQAAQTAYEKWVKAKAAEAALKAEVARGRQ